MKVKAACAIRGFQRGNIQLLQMHKPGGNSLMPHFELPQVAVPSMNAVHAEELEVLAALEKALEDGETDAIAKAARAFLDHVEEHFSREERLMEQYGFPPYPIHRHEHELMRARVKDLCENCASDDGRQALLRFVREEFPAWLTQHVSTMDTVTAQFLAMQGVE